jgi:inorganic pyrophosphatase
MTPFASLHHVPTFTEDTSTFHVVVESPKGAAIKLKYDPDLGAMVLNRPLIGGLTYPFDWGFVPGTSGPDGDPIDAMVVWDVPSYPGVVIPCHALGVVRLEQNSARSPGTRERNDRVLAVPIEAPRHSGIRSIDDLPPRVRDELEQFFLAATLFRGKDPKILGWSGPQEALHLIRESATKSHLPRNGVEG